MLSTLKMYQKYKIISITHTIAHGHIQYIYTHDTLYLDDSYYTVDKNQLYSIKN